jgi:UDP-N-acetyl-D-mannosaminuronate dehydrogenase
MAASLYRQLVTRVLEVSSPTVAKLAKLYENTLSYEGLDTSRTELTPEVVRTADGVVIIPDHREFNYPMVVQNDADFIVDARNAPRGLPVPSGRIIRL